MNFDTAYALVAKYTPEFFIPFVAMAIVSAFCGALLVLTTGIGYLILSFILIIGTLYFVMGKAESILLAMLSEVDSKN